MPKFSPFQQLKLVHAIQHGMKIHPLQSAMCTGLLLTAWVTTPHAASEMPNTPANVSQSMATATANGLTAAEQAEVQQAMQAALDSQKMLDEQIAALAGQDLDRSWPVIAELSPISEQDLAALTPPSVDPVTAEEMDRIELQVQQAQQDATQFLNQEQAEIQQTLRHLPDSPAIDRAALDETVPYSVADLMVKIANDENEVESGTTAEQINVPRAPRALQRPEDLGFFKRLYYRVRPSKLPFVNAPTRINVQTTGGTDVLNANVKARLSNFTIESFREFETARTQLRAWASQAAQAVGYYNAEFVFEKIDDQTLKVHITANDPVIMAAPHMDIRGEGAALAAFQIIELVPDQDEGDIFNHGEYETTKQRFNDAGRENGFFDAYWRLHDVRVLQPQNIAEVDLRYDTGKRYQLGPVTFKMRDESKALPIHESVLQKLVPWQATQDYESWRVDLLSENLINTRYFNYAAVNETIPDPVPRKIELPNDLDQLVKDNQISIEELQQALGEQFELANQAAEQTETDAWSVNLAQLNCRADGTPQPEVYEAYLASRLQQDSEYTLKDADQQNLRKACVRQTKVVPVEVTLMADRLNTLETGIGYGTDTGMRLRSQYRRSIVNQWGHSFEANLEASEIRQALDGRYSIPYKHPLDDVITLVGGYERERRDSLGNGIELDVESAVLGVERSIKARLGDWQHILSARYRFDHLDLMGEGEVNIEDIPPAFLITADSEQESLLFGYEASRTDSDDTLNPTRGLKQTYRIEVGSETLLTETDLAIISAGWRFIYSLGETHKHQFVGRADLGHILTDNFNAVPYNLRFFAGGDQSLRGFDYKSLGDRTDGYLVGGQNLAVGSLEYNYQFKDGWRAAIFSDFGNAYDSDFRTKTEYSAGLGIRWKSPVGPIRLDVAAGISDENLPIRLHFFIGPQL